MKKNHTMFVNKGKKKKICKFHESQNFKTKLDLKELIRYNSKIVIYGRKMTDIIKFLRNVYVNMLKLVNQSWKY